VRVQVGEFLERPAERLVLSPAGRAAAGASAAPPEPDVTAPSASAPQVPATALSAAAGTQPPLDGPPQFEPPQSEPPQSELSQSELSQSELSQSELSLPEPPLHELLLASVPVPVLRSLRERLLGPVREYDARHKADLLPTLTSFLACDGSWSACAARMYVHVNTVRYRIGRIESLTGRDLSVLADRVDFFLALRGA
jgi:hypothetical protein